MQSRAFISLPAVCVAYPDNIMYMLVTHCTGLSAPKLVCDAVALQRDALSRLVANRAQAVPESTSRLQRVRMNSRRVSSVLCAGTVQLRRMSCSRCGHAAWLF